MAVTTVAQFAAELNRPAAALLEQLKSAGVAKASTEDALTREEAERAFAAGMTIADEEVDGGADLLITGDMGIGNTTPATALVSALTGCPPRGITGPGTGITGDALARKAAGGMIDRPAHRPTKKQRRQIHALKDYPE